MRRLYIVILALMALVAGDQKSSSGKPSRAGSSPPLLQEWTFLWTVADSKALQCTIARDKQDPAVLALEVRSLGGKSLFLDRGDGVIGIRVYRLPPTRGEDVLLIEWEAGHRYRLVGLRYLKGAVVTVADMTFDAEDFALVDTDGDGFAEIITW